MGLTKLVFMDDAGYLTRLIPMKSKKTEKGFFVSWKEGSYKDKHFQKIMIQSVYKNRAGELRANFKKNQLDNIYIIPELLSDVMDALAKIFEEHYGINLRQGVTSPTDKTTANLPPPVGEPVLKKEETMEDRIAKLGGIK